MATLESMASLSSKEYLIDIFVGAPPKHVWLIHDAGNDLNWIQCVPCYDCFEQSGPYYAPKDYFLYYRNISYHDPLLTFLERIYGKYIVSISNIE